MGDGWRADGGVRVTGGAVRPGDEGVRRGRGDHRAAGGGGSGDQAGVRVARAVLSEREDSWGAVAVHGVANCREEEIGIGKPLLGLRPGGGRQTLPKPHIDLAEFLADPGECDVELPEY